jgi:hypothetical protein
MNTTAARALAGAALALGLAIAVPGIACAERVWDIGAYDNCMRGIPTIMTPQGYDQAHWQCCRDSGGDYDFGEHKCVSPPAEAENVPGNPNPTVTGKPRPPLAPGGSVG